LEWFTLKIRSLSALVASGLFLVTAALALSGCGKFVLYKVPEFGYAGRPIPPSQMLERVLAAFTSNGSSGGLEMVDGLRDLRGNVQNTVKTFPISGYSEAQPISIMNFPEQTEGLVLSYNDGNLTAINYSKESQTGVLAKFGSNSPSAAAAPTGTMYAGAAPQSGLLVLTVGGATFDLNLPNVAQVSIDPGDSVVLATVQNSDALYRVVKLPSTPNPILPPGYVDCEPLLLPVYCVVPVPGSVITPPAAGTPVTFDHPVSVSYSLDGTTAYVLNSGPENGGTAASVSFLQMSALNINNVPTADTSTAPPLVHANVPIPGGATAGLSDGTTLYVSGQQLQTTGAYKGLFAGNLTLVNLSTYIAGAPVSISDGAHTKMLFADDNTLWIGSSQCSNGVRAATATAELAANGITDQAGNYNCLTMVTLGSSTPTAQIVPAVVQSNTQSSIVPVPYPNTNQNQFYYGSLTGLCWVQNYHKVFTAYGGQIHAFYTGAVPGTTPPPILGDQDANGGPPGSEINNIDITIQGTVYDVAYMDAETNSAN
jgi:hypothetical protein